jgi:hypothetical protein
MIDKKAQVEKLLLKNPSDLSLAEQIEIANYRRDEKIKNPIIEIKPKQETRYSYYGRSKNK